MYHCVNATEGIKDHLGTLITCDNIYHNPLFHVSSYAYLPSLSQQIKDLTQASHAIGSDHHVISSIAGILSFVWLIEVSMKQNP